jgi:hypothetical protein
MEVAGEWKSLENGSRWRIGVAGDWESLDIGSRWRLGIAGDWESLENGKALVGAGEMVVAGDLGLRGGGPWKLIGAGDYHSPAPRFLWSLIFLWPLHFSGPYEGVMQKCSRNSAAFRYHQ